MPDYTFASHPWSMKKICSFNLSMLSHRDKEKNDFLCLAFGKIYFSLPLATSHLCFFMPTDSILIGVHLQTAMRSMTG